jgi:hypothetical protein
MIALVLFDIGFYFNLILGSHSVVGLFEESSVGEVDDLWLLGESEGQAQRQTDNEFEVHISLLKFIRVENII